MTFAETLKEIRFRRRISQSEVARRADCNHTYICRLEDGTRVPSRDMTDALIRALEADPAEAVALREAAGFFSGLPRDVDTFRNYPREVRQTLIRIGEMMTRTGAA